MTYPAMRLGDDKHHADSVGEPEATTQIESSEPSESDSTPEIPVPLEPVRFDVGSLLLLTVFCAVGFTLVRHFGLLGVVGIFLTCGVASIILRMSHIDTRAFWLQAVWGILMPIVCLVMDPILFRSNPFGVPGPFGGASSPIAFASYVFVLWQIAMLCASWFLKPNSPAWASFVAGNLLAGAIFAGAMAAVLVIPAVIFSFFALLGAPGFTPWFTMRVYYCAYQYSRQLAGGHPDATGNRIAGMIVSAVIGVVAYAAWRLM